ncbi:MAG: transcriptional repressor LexA [Acidobacteria bacterium]|nr:transcriptional repressor LexA [Acidobacteriota bacterium]
MLLTPRQKEVFDFLVSFLNRQGYAPTISEIQDHFRLNSPASVHEKLKELEGHGLIRRHKNIHRGIEITQRDSDSLSFVLANFDTHQKLEIPLLGVIQAGSPIEAVLQPEKLLVPADMYSPKRFALKVRGESMRDEQISDGDFIVAEPSANKPINGETVVALIDDSEATVKKFYDERTQIRLQPANDEFQPILISPPTRVTIQGIVRGLIRKFS